MQWKEIVLGKVFAEHNNKMELTNPASVNPEFSEPTTTNIDGLMMINIHQGEKKLVISTGKCFFFGVKKDVKLGTVSMSIVLDETTVEAIEKVVSKAYNTWANPYQRFCIYAKLKIQEQNFDKILPGQKRDRPHDL